MENQQGPEDDKDQSTPNDTDENGVVKSAKETTSIASVEDAAQVPTRRPGLRPEDMAPSGQLTRNTISPKLPSSGRGGDGSDRYDGRTQQVLLGLSGRHL